MHDETTINGLLAKRVVGKDGARPALAGGRYATGRMRAPQDAGEGGCSGMGGQERGGGSLGDQVRASFNRRYLSHSCRRVGTSALLSRLPAGFRLQLGVTHERLYQEAQRSYSNENDGPRTEARHSRKRL